MIAMVQRMIHLEEQMLSHLIFSLKIINYHKMSRKIDIRIEDLECRPFMDCKRILPYVFFCYREKLDRITGY
jgi:hypothetical protein